MVKVATITFLFPSPGLSPAGGYKVVYEYANRLASDGFGVNIVYAGSIFWSKKPLYYKITNCIRYIQRSILGYSCRQWFALDHRVKEVYALSLNYRHVPKSDIYIATSPYTAMYLNEYPIDSSCKYYFIQGYENWGGVTDELLRHTYHYDLRIIVISRWLGKVMEEEQVHYDIVTNGFDFNYFHLTVPIQNKNKYEVVMIYSPIENKGCKYGFDALKKVKKIFPQLHVTLFGSVAEPNDLPEWFVYYYQPDKDLHNQILNNAAIYLATSFQEGWGLPIGEAMICGQAVVCTDNPGYREMAVANENALISPIKDSGSLAQNIERLIRDDGLRFRIAQNGNDHIKGFNIEASYHKLRSILKL